jgi:GNAT superfamily N-acetyltransferase
VPEWRGRGASRALVNAVEVFLRAKGAAGYQVTVTPFAQEHHDLNKFYDKMGFDNEGRMILHRTLK